MERFSESLSRVLSPNTIILSGGGTVIIGATLSMQEIQPVGVIVIAAGIGAIALGQRQSFRELRSGRNQYDQNDTQQ